MIMRSTLGSTNRQKFLLPALVACALLSTVASSPTRSDTTIEPDIDRVGADLKPGFEVADVEQCRQACEAEAQCEAYTFVISPRLCWLKSSVPASVANNCCTSGVKGWRSGPFSTWVNGNDGNRKRPLELDSTHVCALTRVSGKFMGGGESVRVVVVDGRWSLEVASRQNEDWVSGTAHCFRKHGFQANGSDRPTSPLFEAREHQAVSTWNGDAATFIAGVNGHLRGGGEHTRIVQSPDVSGRSELRVGSASGFLKSWAHSFFAGTPGSHDQVPAKFSSGEFRLDHVNALFPGQSVDMAPTETAMCYFTLLKGRFNGSGEWVEIVPAIDSNGVERWRLRAQAGGESEVFVAARCYLRDQRY
jgi:hypothetical protein